MGTVPDMREGGGDPRRSPGRSRSAAVCAGPVLPCIARRAAASEPRVVCGVLVASGEGVVAGLVCGGLGDSVRGVFLGLGAGRS